MKLKEINWGMLYHTILSWQLIWVSLTSLCQCQYNTGHVWADNVEYPWNYSLYSLGIISTCGSQYNNGYIHPEPAPCPHVQNKPHQSQFDLVSSTSPNMNPFFSKIPDSYHPSLPYSTNIPIGFNAFLISLFYHPIPQSLSLILIPLSYSFYVPTFIIQWIRWDQYLILHPLIIIVLILTISHIPHHYLQTIIPYPILPQSCSNLPYPSNPYPIHTFITSIPPHNLSLTYKILHKVPTQPIHLSNQSIHQLQYTINP